MSDTLGQVFDPTKMDYEERTVYEAALDRLVQCYRTYDHVVTWYSGGKDGQLCMELQRRAMDMLGWQDQKTKFIFIDQELIEDEVVKSAEGYYTSDRFEGVWLACPRKDTMVVMGKREDIILWDHARRDDWQRVPPEGAVTDLEGWSVPVSQPTQQRAMMSALKQVWGLSGSICLVNGSRYAENPTIRIALMKSKGTQNWITRNVEGVPGLDVAKPIYDWSMLDVFRFYYEEGVAYPAAYDINLHCGSGLRAGTPPLDTALIEKLGQLRQSYPRLFMQITTIWPEVLTQERYGEDVDVKTFIDKYGPSWTGMWAYVKNEIEDEPTRRLALRALGYAKRRKERFKLIGKQENICYHYPLLHLWRALVKGSFREGQISWVIKPSKEMIEFELKAQGGQ